MRTFLAILLGVIILGREAVALERQPRITQIAATVTQLAPGWTSNRVIVLIDPLCFPSEMADPNESPEGWLKLARGVLRREPRPEAHAKLRYYGAGTGRWHTNSVVSLTRWKTKADIGDNWGRDKDTKDSPGTLPRIGEEVRFSQRHGMHNNITFRRGSYLIDVECPIAYGLEHLKRLAEVLDSNFLKAQNTLATEALPPARRK